MSTLLRSLAVAKAAVLIGPWKRTPLVVGYQLMTIPSHGERGSCTRRVAPDFVSAHCGVGCGTMLSVWRKSFSHWKSMSYVHVGLGVAGAAYACCT